MNCFMISCGKSSVKLSIGITGFLLWRLGRGVVLHGSCGDLFMWDGWAGRSEVTYRSAVFFQTSFVGGPLFRDLKPRHGWIMVLRGVLGILSFGKPTCRISMSLHILAFFSEEVFWQLLMRQASNRNLSTHRSGMCPKPI